MPRRPSPLHCPRGSPVAGFHSHTAPFWSPEARQAASGDHATHCTQFLWFCGHIGGHSWPGDSQQAVNKPNICPFVGLLDKWAGKSNVCFSIRCLWWLAAARAKNRRHTASAKTCVCNARQLVDRVLDSPFCLPAHLCDNEPDQPPTERQCKHHLYCSSPVMARRHVSVTMTWCNIIRCSCQRLAACAAPTRGVSSSMPPGQLYCEESLSTKIQTDCSQSCTFSMPIWPANKEYLL